MDETKRDPETIELPPPGPEPGATGVDDHTSIRPGDLGHQPIDDLDPGVDTENLNSSSQGVKVEQRPEGAPKV